MLSNHSFIGWCFCWAIETRVELWENEKCRVYFFFCKKNLYCNNSIAQLLMPCILDATHRARKKNLGFQLRTSSSQSLVALSFLLFIWYRTFLSTCSSSGWKWKLTCSAGKCTCPALRDGSFFVHWPCAVANKMALLCVFEVSVKRTEIKVFND